MIVDNCEVRIVCTFIDLDEGEEGSLSTVQSILRWWWSYFWYWCWPLFSWLPFFLSLSSLFPPRKSSNLYNHTRTLRWNDNADIAWNQIGQPQIQNRSHQSRGQDQVLTSGSHRAHRLSPKCFPATQKGSIWRNEPYIGNQRWWECLSFVLAITTITINCHLLSSSSDSIGFSKSNAITATMLLHPFHPILMMIICNALKSWKYCGWK